MPARVGLEQQAMCQHTGSAPSPSADHLADSWLSYKAALRLLPANPGGSPVLPPVTRTHQHPCCNCRAHLLLSGQRAAPVISLLTQGPAHIKRIIEICCSQIPAPSGSTQFSNWRLHCPPRGQHRTWSLLNKFRGPFFPTLLREVGTRIQTSEIIPHLDTLPHLPSRGRKQGVGVPSMLPATRRAARARQGMVE